MHSNASRYPLAFSPSIPTELNQETGGNPCPLPGVDRDAMLWEELGRTSP